MTADEAKEARLALGLSQQELAATTELTQPVVAAWESGRIKVPRSVAVDLTWRVAQKERLTALAASGLPECPWVAAFESEAVPDKLDAQTARLESFLQHGETCATCKAREAFIEERFPPMPPAPRPRGWLGIVMSIVEQAQRLPAWAQPAATGALIFTALSLFRVLLLLPAIIQSPLSGLGLAAAGLALSASLGAALGFVYGQYKRLRARWAARRTA